MMLMVAAVLAAIAPGSATSAEVALVNLTGRTIDQLYISPCGARAWGPNQLAWSPVLSSRSFNISNIEAGCYDVMVVLPPWNECIISGLALRRGVVWTITKATVTQAVSGDCSMIAGIASSGRRPWHWNE
jgi:hypothetical protein